MWPISATKWVRRGVRPCSYASSNGLRKSPRKREARGDAERRVRFQPHAIIVIERSVPSPIFVAALVGVDPGEATRADHRLRETSRGDRQLRPGSCGLKGDPIETLTTTVQCTKAYLSLPPDKKDMSVRIGKALGLR
jgi:hypothetical protein